MKLQTGACQFSASTIENTQPREPSLCFSDGCGTTRSPEARCACSEKACCAATQQEKFEIMNGSGVGSSK
jgi:hypothetical protein